MTLLLTAEQVAERTGLSRSAAYDLIKRVAPVRLGRSLRISERRLTEYLENGGDLCIDSTSAAASGTRADTTSTASAGARHLPRRAARGGRAMTPEREADIRAARDADCERCDRCGCNVCVLLAEVDRLRAERDRLREAARASMVCGCGGASGCPWTPLHRALAETAPKEEG